jgi:hypothetical protein
MKRKQHHTSAKLRWSLTGLEGRIGFECWWDGGRGEVETLWRILLHRARLSPDWGRP